MSQRALILGTVQVLRTVLGLDATGCDETPRGQPPPTSVGKPAFYGVWDGDWRAGQTDEVLDEYYGVTVTVSMAIGSVPWDRIAATLISAPTTGLAARLERLRVLVHNSYPVLTAANAVIAADPAASGVSPVYGFAEPLRFVDGGRRTEKRHDWFWSRPRADPRRRTDLIAGYAQTMTFGRARRPQNSQDPKGWS